MLGNTLIYLAAALAEIGGCFAFWAWRHHRGENPAWLLPGLGLLALFAYLLALIDTAHAGRAYAAYGGIYIGTALLWMWCVEGVMPTRWDLVGGILSILGACVILTGQRAVSGAP